ncbi:hypothetical protein GCM10009592_28720 [Brachybacterium rhamnosum]
MQTVLDGHEAGVRVGPGAAPTGRLPQLPTGWDLERQCREAPETDLASPQVDEVDLVVVGEVRLQLLREVREKLEEADQFPRLVASMTS